MVRAACAGAFNTPAAATPHHTITTAAAAAAAAAFMDVRMEVTETKNETHDDASKQAEKTEQTHRRIVFVEISVHQLL